MRNIATTDIVIIGGGIAGLWLFNRLRQQGYSAILLESGALGGGQTHKSQGIIHGGMKYALQGKLTHASQTIADMPTVWKRCLEGNGEVDLRQVPVLSAYQYLWSSNKLSGSLTGFFANIALKGRVEKLSKADYPDIFKSPEFKGVVYSLAEMAIDVHAVIRELAKPYQDSIFKIDAFNEEQLELAENGSLRALTITAENATPVRIEAQNYIFVAGEGNETIIKKFNQPDVAMQRRPLHMVIVKTNFSYPVFAHCLGMGGTPRITITTHLADDGKAVWYLGGQIAEEGVLRNQAEQVELARKELQELLPWLNFANARFASFYIDRAEAEQPGGKRPDSTSIKQIKNCIIAWPTKLAFAPRLAEEILETISLEKKPADISALRHFPKPAVAKPIWDELL